MSNQWIECFDLQQSRHVAWVRADLIEAVRVEAPKGGVGETWQIYVDARDQAYRFGELHVDRSAAIAAAEALVARLDNN